MAFHIEVLNMSKTAFQAQKARIGEVYDKIVVGAAIFRHNATVLLLKRSSNDDYYPGIFELPSGKVDDDDITIKAELVREVKEETGLDVLSVLQELKPMVYTTEKTVVINGRNELVRKRAIQLNYVVDVDEGEVVLDSKEHSEFVWAMEEDLEALRVTAEMKIVVREAFAALRS